MSDKLNFSTYRPGLLPLNLGERGFATGIPFQILVSFASSEDGKQTTENRRQRTEIFSRLAHEIESGKNLKQAFHHLNSTQQDSLREAIGKGTLAELLSLSQETDQELFYESLLHFGVRLKSRSEFEKASVVFSLLGGGAAEKEYNSIVGKGDIGKRLEVLSSRLARDACDWRMIVPMIGASALGATVASSVLGRLVSNPIASGFTRGIGARFSAGAVGYLAEFPAFAALGRVMAENSEGSFAEDLERSALAIGALKVFGWIGQQVGASLAAPFWALRAQRAGQALPLQFLISQSSIFVGLLASHKLEEEFNLRPHVDGATFVTDTLASMFTMSVGSHLGHRVLGEWGSNIENQKTLHSSPFTLHPSHPLFAPMWAMMGMGVGGMAGRTPKIKIRFPRPLSNPASQTEIAEALRAIVKQDAQTYPNADPLKLSGYDPNFVHRWYKIGGQDVTLNTLAGWWRRAKGLRFNDRKALPNSSILREWLTEVFQIPQHQLNRPAFVLSVDFLISPRPTEAEVFKILRAIVTQDSEFYPKGDYDRLGTGKKRFVGRRYQIGKRQLTLHTLADWLRRSRGLGPEGREVLSYGAIVHQWKQGLRR